MAREDPARPTDDRANRLAEDQPAPERLPGLESGWLQALGAVGRELRRLARSDPDLRRSVRALAYETLRLTDADASVDDVAAGDLAAAEAAFKGIAAPDVAAAEDDRSTAPPSPAAPQAEAPPEDVRDVIAQIIRQRDAERDRLAEREIQRTQARLAATVPDGDGDEDLPRISAGARVKAEAARWVGERQRRIARRADWPTEIGPHDRAMLDRAHAANVNVWMCRPDAAVPADPSAWDDLAGNFEVLADAVDLVAALLQRPNADREFAVAVALAAEAQSGLRLAVAGLGCNSDDAQHALYRWLQRTAAARRMHIGRYMQTRDAPDPAAWADLRARVQASATDVRDHADRDQLLRKAWGRLRHHLGLIAADPTTARQADWTRAMAAVGALVNHGVPPSDTELREALLPHIEALPHDVALGKGATLTIREIESFVAGREAEAYATARADVDAVDAGVTAEVAQVAALLHGRAIVLIGGVRRQHRADAIARAFGLSELVWEDGEVASYTHFEPAVARRDVALVVLMIRWASHGYKDVKGYCDAYDKPLVRLPAGYGPNQLAVQILAQVGDRLGGSAMRLDQAGLV